MPIGGCEADAVGRGREKSNKGEKKKRQERKKRKKCKKINNGKRKKQSEKGRGRTEKLIYFVFFFYEFMQKYFKLENGIILFLIHNVVFG